MNWKSLSPHENKALRENLLPLGITTMSAGSKTNPGGYGEDSDSLEQFSISDERSLPNIQNAQGKRI